MVSARARRQRAGHNNDVFYGGVGRCGDGDALVVAYDSSRRLAIRIAILEEGDVRLEWISTGAYMEYWSVFVSDGIDVSLDLCAGSCRAATCMARLLDVDKVIAIDVTSKFRDLAEKKEFFGDDDPADSKVDLIKADLIDDYFLRSLIRKFPRVEARRLPPEGLLLTAGTSAYRLTSWTETARPTRSGGALSSPRSPGSARAWS